jgi:hypothetical protein
MVARGTLGGQRRADGSNIESGVHLRWQVAPELGFPPGGFDLYRRVENFGHFLRCGTFREADVVGVRWTPDKDEHVRPGVTLSFAGRSRVVRACGADDAGAASFPGEREVRLDFEEPVRIVRLTFDGRMGDDPIVAAYWNPSTGPVLMEQQQAHQRAEVRTATVFADRIDYLTLRGQDMVICELCFVLLVEGQQFGWPPTPLNGDTPIYLPITHPDWSSPHAHSPDDQAEAEARLPPGLAAPKRQAYAEGFRDELHPILYSLVGTDPQRLHQLKHGDLESAATLDWPGMSLLQLMALDPNMARVLGLYWHDEPPRTNAYYDYRVVAHYGDTPYPGKPFGFSGLEPGRRFGSLLAHEGVTYVSPNPIEAARTTWDGSEHTGLLFSRDIPAGPISITLPEPVQSVTLRLVSSRALSARAFLGVKSIATQLKPPGEMTLLFEEPGGINRILLLPVGEVNLVEIVLREHIGGLADLVYDVFHVRLETAPAASAPSLDPPKVTASATGLDEQGRLMPNQSRVDLRWERQEAGSRYLRSDAPVFFLVERVDLAADGKTVLRKAILNESAPALVSERGAAGRGAESPMYSDRSVPEGVYRYAVRGIDLFGVLGDWGQSQRVEVRERRAPPPPQAVQALYLDPADPWLSEDDKGWVATHGPGVKLSWRWPGPFSLQAPDVVAPHAEFRAYAVEGALNRLDGTVTAVTSRGGTSDLASDIDWPGAAGALAGESIRVNQSFFTIAGNTQGAGCIVTVANLTMPDRAPEPGPCSLTFSTGRSYWRDYREARQWQRRLHAEPVRDAPRVSGHVVVVEVVDPATLASDTATVFARPGATRTVTLDQALQDADGALLPGALLCDGVVYLAYGHSLGDALRIHLVPAVAPAASTSLIEPAVGAACDYYPGRRYEVRVPGLDLAIARGQAGAVAHIAMSCSDGQTQVEDDPIWSRPGRGGLGGRPGNESALSPAVMIRRIRRRAPAAVANVPAAPAEPIFARPANYYGQARYTLSWEALPDAQGYAVYRCSGAALFDQDRALRQSRKGAYASGSVFADDPGFASWLAGFDPALTETEMVSDAARHLDAWRAWARRFYPGRSDGEVQAMAQRAGNEAAFRRLNQDPITTTAFADTFDGRGRGFYLYRVRAIDAAGNLSAWAETRPFPPVHILDVTPPAPPVITAIAGGENRITIRWARSPGFEIAGYLLYRTQSRQTSNDWRQMELIKADDADVFTVAVDGVPPTKELEFVDLTVVARQPYFYGLVAVRRDDRGNEFRSSLSPARGGQAYDLTPPEPPAWDAVSTGRVHVALDGTIYEWADDVPDGVDAAPANRLVWEVTDEKLTYLVQRLAEGANTWKTLLGFDAPLEVQNARATLIDQMDISDSVYHDYRIYSRAPSQIVSLSATRMTIYA